MRWPWGHRVTTTPDRSADVLRVQRETLVVATNIRAELDRLSQLLDEEGETRDDE